MPVIGRGRRWYFSSDVLSMTPSRRDRITVEKEDSYRQQAAIFIQDMGQRLQVTQLCINTAIVYMQRFYMFHSHTRFHRNSVSAAALFLSAKVEEQPRKLEHVLKVARICSHKDRLDPASQHYMDKVEEAVTIERILLQTLGFDVSVEHPHTYVVKCLVKAPKELAQSAYSLATNSLHLTTMCLRYTPSIVACVCINMACIWSKYEMPLSESGKPWYSYVEPSTSVEQIEQLSQDFLTILSKCPGDIKKKILPNHRYDIAKKDDRKHTQSSQYKLGHQQQSTSSSEGGSSEVVPRSSKQQYKMPRNPPSNAQPSHTHSFDEHSTIPPQAPQQPLPSVQHLGGGEKQQVTDIACQGSSDPSLESKIVNSDILCMVEKQLDQSDGVFPPVCVPKPSQSPTVGISQPGKSLNSPTLHQNTLIAKSAFEMSSNRQENILERKRKLSPGSVSDEKKSRITSPHPCGPSFEERNPPSSLSSSTVMSMNASSRTTVDVTDNVDEVFTEVPESSVTVQESVHGVVSKERNKNFELPFQHCTVTSTDSQHKSGASASHVKAVEKRRDEDETRNDCNRSIGGQLKSVEHASTTKGGTEEWILKDRKDAQIKSKKEKKERKVEKEKKVKKDKKEKNKDDDKDEIGRKNKKKKKSKDRDKDKDKVKD